MPGHSQRKGEPASTITRIGHSAPIDPPHVRTQLLSTTDPLSHLPLSHRVAPRIQSPPKIPRLRNPQAAHLGSLHPSIPRRSCKLSVPARRKETQCPNTVEWTADMLVREETCETGWMSCGVCGFGNGWCVVVVVVVAGRCRCCC